MSSFQIPAFLGVHRMTPGRRRLVLQQMSDLLCGDASPAHATLRGSIERSIALHDQALVALAEWQVSGESIAQHGEGARKLDAELDRTLGGLCGMLSMQIKALGSDTQKGKLAERLLQQLFPQGPAAITRLPYADQHAAVRTLLHRLATEPALREAAEALHLSDITERLAEINRDYGALLSKAASTGREAATRADDASWHAMAEVIVRVLGAHPTDAPADLAARERILGPLVRQQAQAAALRKRRRSRDELPEAWLGEETPAEDEPPEAAEPETAEPEAPEPEALSA